jgi:uncharacterized protein YlbG (UPF0298 family)
MGFNDGTETHLSGRSHGSMMLSDDAEDLVYVYLYVDETEVSHRIQPMHCLQKVQRSHPIHANLSSSLFQEELRAT